jgi:hypothetical protein
VAARDREADANFCKYNNYYNNLDRHPVTR